MLSLSKRTKAHSYMNDTSEWADCISFQIGHMKPSGYELEPWYFQFENRQLDMIKVRSSSLQDRSALQGLDVAEAGLRRG